IVQVSMQSGFSSLSTFNRTFKEIHGCTPTEYRAIYEKTQPMEHQHE
ncbi:MAG: helix-turn-helix domain-containing protein, partial [Clostridia bacterium]|nr:helix-turn-helix domain-containing protein [Clostridia bacterium]